MSGKQETLFYSSEGDQWFRRNRTALVGFDPARDLPLRLMDLYQLRPKRVLEIGAANGYRLAEVNRRYGGETVGVEASQEAVQDGRRRYPSVRLLRGQATRLPVRGTFDLIIVNFVFHWIDRNLLLSAVAELDRFLSDQGFLLLGDFSPANRHRVPYHHVKDPSIQTFKQNYAELFLASGLYHPVAMLTNGHSSKVLSGGVPENERTGVWLLEKRLTDHYVPTSSVLGTQRKIRRP
ncbi:MAG: class I SAM-dependent methyltransferase [Elusimicrobia bacterium]|nr:class I SAM-dependent methyltransferase [Elusimicrobiota bacterium]